MSIAVMFSVMAIGLMDALGRAACICALRSCTEQE
jgi:hypothetical protein